MAVQSAVRAGNPLVSGHQAGLCCSSALQLREASTRTRSPCLQPTEQRSQEACRARRSEAGRPQGHTKMRKTQSTPNWAREVATHSHCCEPAGASHCWAMPQRESQHADRKSLVAGWKHELQLFPKQHALVARQSRANDALAGSAAQPLLREGERHELQLHATTRT
jgi:hypothetical protein